MKTFTALAASVVVASSLLAQPAQAAPAPEAGAAVVQKAVDGVEQGTVFRDVWCKFMPC